MSREFDVNIFNNFDTSQGLCEQQDYLMSHIREVYGRYQEFNENTQSMIQSIIENLINGDYGSTYPEYWYLVIALKSLKE